MSELTSLTGEHAEDVFGQWLEWRANGQDVALVFVTSTEGGAVRAPGALMAVSIGHSIGYISGGCIDADVILQARAALSDKQVRELRYGAGSPFVDLPLPCGGAIEVLIVPDPNMEAISEAYADLMARHRVSLCVSAEGDIEPAQTRPTSAIRKYAFIYPPKLRLRIAGRGADALALAKISEAAGYETRLQLVDSDDADAAQSAGLTRVEMLDTPGALLPGDDDEWTAFVLLFHDRDWEIPLLKQALSGPAFYIGAVGSRRTHQVRCDALVEAGIDAEPIGRVRGPIGLVPSLRDASMLAVSVLAEIINAFPERSSSRRPRTALLMLAAGASRRFEDGDKLIADLDGHSVLARSGMLTKRDEMVTQCAVIGRQTVARRRILEPLGWDVLENPDSAQGQASSLALGIQKISEMEDVDQVIILLGDMPFIPQSHLDALLKRAESPSVSAIMSQAGELLTPPALFKRTHFEALQHLTGDRGAKAFFLNLPSGTATVELDPDQAADIDCVADMQRAKEHIDA